MANILTHPTNGAIYFGDGTAGSSTVPALTGGAVSLKYDGSAGLNIASYNTTSTDRFSIDGSSGRLFSVNDSLTGTIFSVNDAAGLPIIEVESTSSTDTITMGTYASNALVVAGDKVGIGTSTPNASYKLDVVGAIRASTAIHADGDLSATGDLEVFGSATISTIAAATSAHQGFLVRENAAGLVKLRTRAQVLSDIGGVDLTSAQDIGGNKTFSNNVIVSGNLTVDGTTTTINSTTVAVDDKNIELGTVASPTDATADGGGITLKGATDKTIGWVNSTDAWTFSERVSIPAGSASTPSLTFSTDGDTGFFNRTPGELNAAVNGSWIGAWNPNGLLIYSGTGIFNRLGSASAPSYTFSGDTDTGIYRISADSLGITTGGTLRAQFNNTGIVSSLNLYSSSGGEFRNYGGTWQGTTGLTGNGFQFVNSVDGTALTISSTGDTVASGKITSGNDIVNATAGVYTWVGDTDTYIQRSAGNEITIKTGASNALVLDSSQNATFAGNIIAGGAVYPATNAAASLGLSNKQWAGLDLSSSSAITWGNGDAEIIEGETNNYSLTFKTYDGSANSAALRLDGDNTATFTGNIIALTGAGSGNITVGRNANEKTVIDVGDQANSITAYQDSDGNATHNFVLNRVFGGTGTNDFIIQKDGTAQFTLDTSANATFAGTITSANILPISDAAYTIGGGSSSLRWNYLYLNNTLSITDGNINAGTTFDFNQGANFLGNVSIAEKLIHTGDTNTYIQFPDTNDKIVFATNGSDVLTLDASNTATFAGNVEIAYNGIALDIENSSLNGSDTGIRIRGARNGQNYATNSITSYILLSNYDDNTTPNSYDLVKIGAGMYDASDDTGYLRFETNNGTALTKAFDIDKNQDAKFYGDVDSDGNITASNLNVSNWDTAHTHTSATNNPHSVTKTQVGLSNVTNESKLDMFASPTFTGTATLPSGSIVSGGVGLGDNSTKIATTAYVQGQGYTNDQTAAEILTAIKTVDGTGSGLDADTVDGIEGGSLLRSNADDIYTGALTFGSAASKINGSDGFPLVQVNSSRAYFGSTSRAVTTLASSSSTGVKAHVTGTDYTVWHAGNDGTGSGLDADLLDGQEGSYYATAGDENIIDGATSIWNADGDGDVFNYNDSNPTHNGKYVGAVINIHGDGAADSSLVRAGLFTSNLMSTLNGYYVGALLGNANSTTTQVINSSGAWTGSVIPSAKLSTATTQSSSDNSTKIATTAYVKSQGYLTSYTETNAFLGDGGSLLTHPGTSRLIYTGPISAGTSGLFATADNANSVITLNRHSGNYNSQLGFSSNGNVYYRGFNNTAINTTQGWNTMWHSGNDGTGSGLDADLLDGQEGSYYATSGHSHNYLTDNGYQLRLSSTNEVELFNGSGTLVDMYLQYNGGVNSLHGPAGSIIWHAGNDGTGTGLDADLLDGYHATAFQGAIAAPNAPASVTTTIVGETIDVTFAASTTSNIDAYLVYSSIAGSDYGLISVVPPDDFSSSMSIIDNSFDETGTQAYRVYAMKLGKLSSATTGSVSYTVSTADPTTMSVVNLNNAYYVQWNPPSSNSRFVTVYNVYKHEHATQASLSRASASLVYSGTNTNYMYQINGTNNNNFHQFWVETTIA